MFNLIIILNETVLTTNNNNITANYPNQLKLTAAVDDDEIHSLI